MGNFEEEMREQLEEEIRKERNEEFNEIVDEYKVEFIDENVDDLIKEFITNNQNEFNEFLSNEIIDDERNYEYWVEVFCKEMKENEFNNYCDECYSDYEDVRATERSIINDIQKM